MKAHIPPGIAYRGAQSAWPREWALGGSVGLPRRDGADGEIEDGSPRTERQEEIMKTFTAFVLVAFSLALPAAFLLQIALV